MCCEDERKCNFYLIIITTTYNLEMCYKSLFYKYKIWFSNLLIEFLLISFMFH